MEEDIASDPIQVGLFGAAGIMFQTDGITDLVKELLALWGGMDRFRHGIIDRRKGKDIMKIKLSFFNIERYICQMEIGGYIVTVYKQLDGDSITDSWAVVSTLIITSKEAKK